MTQDTGLPQHDIISFEDALSQVQELLNSEVESSTTSDKLSELLAALHPSILNEVLLNFNEEKQRTLLVHITGLDTVSDLMAFSSKELQLLLLDILDDSRLAAVIRRIDIDDAADVLAIVPRRRQVKILKRLNAPLVKELSSLLAYDAQTAGGIMTPRFVSLDPNLRADSALAHIQIGLHEGTIEQDTDLAICYVSSPSGELLGCLSLRELLKSDKDALVSDLMRTIEISVNPDDHQEEVAWKIADYDLPSIPVVSKEDGHILGIITVDDVLDVLTEEYTAEVSKMAGTDESDTVGATLKTSIKSRLPWLLVSWAGGTMGAVLLGSYSEEIAKMVALTFFMPVVFGMGGNVGSQSSTITVRGLATGELTQSRLLRRIRKEISVGAILGSIFAILLGTVSFFMFSQVNLSLVVAGSILTTMTISSGLGSLLPYVFDKLGFDPAFGAGPLVTTTTDIISIGVYFTVASVLL